jgi:DNA-binding protein H-NS
MSTQQLWLLFEELSASLEEKLIAQKSMLDDRSRHLNRLNGRTSGTSPRRPYPSVVPKFVNPDRPSETWAGRGKRPRWLDAQLKSGKQIEDFRIGF